MREAERREIVAGLLDGVFLCALLAAAGWWMVGSEMASLMGIVGVMIWQRTSHGAEVARLRQEIWRLQSRMLDCEEGKASAEWVARQIGSLERADQLNERYIERVEARIT